MGFSFISCWSKIRRKVTINGMWNFYEILMLVSKIKVLLEHSHTYLFTHCLWRLPHSSSRAEYLGHRPWIPSCLIALHSSSFTENHSDSYNSAIFLVPCILLYHNIYFINITCHVKRKKWNLNIAIVVHWCKLFCYQIS